ncbi:hypothetical protein AB1Y20_015203 [Prymnesium parvum]|uniref:Anaphase-promoting complex subunit 11 n=1 Tax=Prymnesium parvum TaxID=97485 RepID=A0AB34JZZ7_PRYPA
MQSAAPALAAGALMLALAAWLQSSAFTLVVAALVGLAASWDASRRSHAVLPPPAAESPAPCRGTELQLPDDGAAVGLASSEAVPHHITLATALEGDPAPPEGSGETHRIGEATPPERNGDTPRIGEATPPERNGDTPRIGEARPPEGSGDTPLVGQTPPPEGNGGTPHTCLACGKRSPSMRRCSQCKQAHFCNRDCQLRAWSAGHKDECRPATQPAAESTRKSPVTSPPAAAAAAADDDDVRRLAAELMAVGTPSALRSALEEWRRDGALARALGDRGRWCEAVRMAAHAALKLGRVEEARHEAEEAVRLATLLDDTTLRVQAHSCLGTVQMRQGVEAACGELQAAVALCEASAAARPSLEAEAMARANLGRCLLECGRDQEGLVQMRKAVALRKLIHAFIAETASSDDPVRMESVRSLATALANLGAMYASMEGERAEVNAQATLQEALVLARSAGNKSLEQTILTNLVNTTTGMEHGTHASSLQGLLQTLGRTSGHECAICLENLPVIGFNQKDEDRKPAVTALECGHMYCRDCFERLPTSRCPQCLMPLPIIPNAQRVVQ